MQLGKKESKHPNWKRSKTLILYGMILYFMEIPKESTKKPNSLINKFSKTRYMITDLGEL